METRTPEKPTASFLSSGGTCGQLCRTYDWESTTLGPVHTWPQSLRSAVSICLNSNFPIAIYWGPDLTLLYNDAWSPIPGNKHPWALGKPAKEVWPEIWDALQPQFEKAFEGEPGGSKNALLPMNRHGYVEECYFDFTFTPIYGEAGKVEGVFNAVIETTSNILNERQLKTLRDLGNVDNTSTNVDEVFQYAANAIQKNDKDFPFGIIYKIDKTQETAFPIAYVGIDEEQNVFPSSINLKEATPDTRNFFQAYSTNQIVVSDNNGRRTNLPKGGWDKEARQFLHLPIATQNRQAPVAIFSTALNPYRQFDETYQQFVELVADQISTEVNNRLAFEEEKKRAEALAEIDKAKTAFFTNISHEFRTPLTLILGTVEELLQTPASAENQQLKVTHRNAVRLLKLVNTLLDFSRLEAGRINAVFQPTDLASLTANIAANFRSAIEKAGLTYQVDCRTIGAPVFVDRDMWEKIVLNLLSNAFKYTLTGSIGVTLSATETHAILKVKDTGAGIPKEELPRMFERFHRVQQTVGRSFEGSGIGLSLVNELVQLHSGTISLESELGVGTEFTITIPLGKNHLPAEHIIHKTETDVQNTADAFLEEASALLMSEQTQHTPVLNGADTVLVVDDNADMRTYIKNLLQQQFTVITATNGVEALQAIESSKPALVVSDVMMPEMDGTQLLKTIKSNPHTASLPVILVSARAGDEARIEGLDIGADDYLVKPFSGKELLARVRSQINLKRKQQAALQSIYHLFNEVPFAVAALKGKDLEIEFINQYNLDVWQMKKEDVLGKPMFEVRPDIREGAEPIHREVYKSGRRFTANEIPISITNNGETQVRYFNSIIDPLYDEEGHISGQLATTIEVTEQVLLRKKIEESEMRLRSLANAMPQVVWIAESNGEVTYYNDRVQAFQGVKKLDDGNWSWQGMVHPDDIEGTSKAWEQAVSNAVQYEKEHRICMHDGTYRWHLSRALPEKDETGTVLKWYGTATDIEDQKTISVKLEKLVAERTRELERSNEDLQQFAHVASHDLKEPVRKVMTFANRLKDELGTNLSEQSLLFLSKIESSAIRMYSMIDGVLLYSSLNALQQTKELIELDEVIQNIQSDLEVAMAEKGATITFKELPAIEGSAILIYQLFYNLLNNALKFSSPERKPHILITANPVSELEIAEQQLESEKEYVKISIQDNGIGFRSQYADKIFGTFTRLHAKDKYEGTGLGLSLCKKIAERHGGAIFADGKENEGATFTVLLPVS